MTEEQAKALIFSMRKEGTGQLPHMNIRGKEESIPGPGGPIRVLTYRPEGNGPFPVYLNFHGGGFIMGLPEFDDAFCHRVCQELGLSYGMFWPTRSSTRRILPAWPSAATAPAAR